MFLLELKGRIGYQYNETDQSYQHLQFTKRLVCAEDYGPYH